MTEPIYQETITAEGKRLSCYDIKMRLHSINDLPAYIEYYPNGSLKAQHWFRADRRHRDNDEPAVITYHVSDVTSTQLTSTQLTSTQLTSTQITSTQITSTQLTSTQLTTQLNPPSNAIVAEMAWYVYGQQYERDDDQANYKYFDRNGKLREERKYVMNYHYYYSDDYCDIDCIRYRPRSSSLDIYSELDDELDDELNDDQLEKWDDEICYYLHNYYEPALIRYYPDGAVMSEEHFESGKYSSRTRVNRVDYYLDGSIKTEYCFEDDGTLVAHFYHRGDNKPVLIHYKNEKPLLEIYPLSIFSVPQKYRIVVYDQTNNTNSEYEDVFNDIDILLNRYVYTN